MLATGISQPPFYASPNAYTPSWSGLLVLLNPIPSVTHTTSVDTCQPWLAASQQQTVFLFHTTPVRNGRVIGLSSGCLGIRVQCSPGMRISHPLWLVSQSGRPILCYRIMSSIFWELWEIIEVKCVVNITFKGERSEKAGFSFLGNVILFLV